MWEEEVFALHLNYLIIRNYFVMHIKLTHNKLTGCYQFPLLILFFCITNTPLSAQFSGGNGDGFASGSIGASGTEVLLPITLVSFDAEDKGDSVKLIWETATETNNDHFTVEKSINGTNWVEVKIIKGAGNSTSIHDYETFDNAPYSGLSYYHLKQTDYDGKTTVSRMESIYRGNGSEGFSLFPNPTRNVLVLNIKESMGMASVTIFNIYGQLVWSTIQNTSIKKEEIIDISSLKAGSYFIRIASSTDKNNSFGCQFIKTE